jgi:hypothetical protein
MKNQIFILALIALISSCTVVKRVHQPGYYVSWHKQHKAIPSSVEQLLVQNETESTDVQKNSLVAENVLPTSDDSQNILQSDEVINVGSVESKPVIVSIKTTTPQVETSKILSKKAIKAINNTKHKKATNSASSGDGKSQVVALILAILLGGIGIHRFYLGHIGMGILYLFTAGLCGIGWLIDIILIATGSLEPKDGSYDKTL